MKTKTFSDTLILGEMLNCPVCGKEFKVSVDTNAIAMGGYTCSWKCFLDATKSKHSETKQENTDTQKDNIVSIDAPIKRKRGRPRKEVS